MGLSDRIVLLREGRQMGTATREQLGDQHHDRGPRRHHAHPRRGHGVTRWTVFGCNAYAQGSSMEATRLSGIDVGRVTIGVHVLRPAVAGAAGILFASRIANGVPSAGQGHEEAIAAAVIGGASPSGAILMQHLRNGGDLLGINPFIREFLIGALASGPPAEGGRGRPPARGAW